MFDPSKFTDVIYEVRDRAAWIIINRPKVYNRLSRPDARRADPGLPDAAQRPGHRRSIVLTGAGDKAFCTGGDQSAHEGQYDGRGIDRPADRRVAAA